jgi:hypothetical protein
MPRLRDWTVHTLESLDWSRKESFEYIGEVATETVHRTHKVQSLLFSALFPHARVVFIVRN